MKKKKYNITLINTISSFVLQLLMIANGFIIPKLILTYFGSDVNGLVASLTKFLSYISILEGGVSGVIMASLYKPLNENDHKKVSSIIVTTESFYKKISYIFILYSLIIAIIYPIVFHTNFSYLYIFSLTIILSIYLFIQYCFSFTYRTLLKADKKVYYESMVHSVLLVLNIVFSIILMKIYPNVHVLKLFAALIFVAQPVIFNIYVKKNYKIDKKAVKDDNLLKARWDGFSYNIAAFIHTNTDILILNIFSTLATVSVYSVYALVGSGLRTLLSSFSRGVAPTIGQLYAKNDLKVLNNRFDIYETVVFFVVFLMFATACLLIVPFVMIYTRNITDANYYQPLFGVILMIAEAIYLIEMPHVDLAFAANKFKEIKRPAYLEAIINIVVSVLLVKKFGLIGVAIGTFVATLYRLIFHVSFTKKIIDRSITIFYRKAMLFILGTVIGVLICIFLIPSVQYTIISWIWHAIVYVIILSTVYVLISVIFLKKEVQNILKFIK